MAPLADQGPLPPNLSRQAVKDLLRILDHSARSFGVPVARRSAERILGQCRAIRDGTAVGHRRADIRPRTPTLFVSEPPWVIAFDPETRLVTRILHGAREFPALFS